MDDQDISMSSTTALQKNELGHDHPECKLFTITSSQKLNLVEDRTVSTSPGISTISNNLSNVECKVQQEDVLNPRVVNDTNLENFNDTDLFITDTQEIDYNV
jgi:hypothetical protein